METGGSSDAAGTVIGEAFTQFSNSVKNLIDCVAQGGLEPLTDPDSLTMMQRFEMVRNELSVVDHAMIGDIERRDLAGSLCQGSVARVLTSTLSVSKAEASRRVKAAAAVGRRMSMTGGWLPPLRPVLAAAQQSGEVSAEKVTIVAKALAGVDRFGFDPADVDAGEALLTEHAGIFPPEALRILAARVVEAIDPDGTLPEEQLAHDRRHLSMKPTPDGGYAGEFRLTGACGSKLVALLNPLARPRATPEDCGGQVDPRTHGQRMYDAWEDLIDRTLRAGTITETGGVPATVIVTISADQLSRQLQIRAATTNADHPSAEAADQAAGGGVGTKISVRGGFGQTTDGTLLSTRALLELANNAEIIPVVLNSCGAVLDLGRTRRIASRTQTLALVARDQGCSFPHCSHPPQYCERHHIKEWIDGGNTNLNNLTLLCRYHHHNFLSRGWQVELNHDGIPEWTPPKWVDRQQHRMINTRITTALIAKRTARDDPQ